MIDPFLEQICNLKFEICRYHPISLSPHLLIIILMGMANFFTDNIIIHISRPDAGNTAPVKMEIDLRSG